MDFVTTTEKIGRLWQDDRPLLVKMAFALECLKAVDVTYTHQVFVQLFKSLLANVVTALQGQCEWHITRRFSLISTATHALIKTLLHHCLAPYIKYRVDVFIIHLKPCNTSPYSPQWT